MDRNLFLVVPHFIMVLRNMVQVPSTGSAPKFVLFWWKIQAGVTAPTTLATASGGWGGRGFNGLGNGSHLLLDQGRNLGGNVGGQRGSGKGGSSGELLHAIGDGVVDVRLDHARDIEGAQSFSWGPVGDAVTIKLLSQFNRQK